MFLENTTRYLCCPALVAGLMLLPAPCPAGAVELHVNPAGSDDAAGTQEAPFATLPRAQAAVREAAPNMDADIVVSLAPGVYRLDATLELTEADSGRNGHRVIYRSAAGPGQARILGSVPLTGWREYRDGIWKLDLPEGMTFNTLYEDGRRAWKARFPNYEHHPEMPTARGRYLVSVDGMPRPKRDADPSEMKGPGWLIYPPEDEPPVLLGPKTKILIFPGGKYDWMRQIHRVMEIDREARRLTFAATTLRHGVGAGSRYFLEDDLALLDAPGEFFIDEAESTLYYMPIGDGHPDTLGIAAPVLNRLIQIQGESRDRCAENIVLDGLALEETDDSPPTGWWGTGYGRRDGALVWMSNANRVEIRNCRLRNGGRSGIMMVGHNTNNVVTGCWIGHMGVNGVTLSNRFSNAEGTAATEDRCEGNRIHNCRIHDVGEIHCYAACVNVFNASHNEVCHCELYNSVRYAITVRGNTGAEHGPLVPVNLPPAGGNRFHHLRVSGCGQDSGDMGALHCANLNLPDGDAVNTFEQITVDDCRAIPSMKDRGPNAVFLDWPKMSMHQVFRNIRVRGMQDRDIVSHGPDNAASAVKENVSWEPGFSEELMDHEKIGLTGEFPAEYGGRPR